MRKESGQRASVIQTPGTVGQCYSTLELTAFSTFKLSASLHVYFQSLGGTENAGDTQISG